MGFFLLASTATHNEYLQAEALERAKLPVFRQESFGGMTDKTSTICKGAADICIASSSHGIIVKAELEWEGVPWAL